MAGAPTPIPRPAADAAPPFATVPQGARTPTSTCRPPTDSASSSASSGSTAPPSSLRGGRVTPPTSAPPSASRTHSKSWGCSRLGLRRIGGLLAGDRGDLEEGSEMREMVKEGGALMYRARKLLRCDVDGGCESGEGGGDVEKAVLWAVVMNAVEVQVGEGRAIGIAVYGPQFSWFNHNCSLNACYRFELLGSECFRSAGSRFLVHPTATGSEDGMDHNGTLNGSQQQKRFGDVFVSW
ncbi:hypothetical protein Taro_043912 [Colocasia esculenta]|uniref:SET domain-containing protein n=1 Tax=Colocasia esculenta TaxID=4460 RepID=A0A843WHN2_COLES|nr:hypothetical protein [Colocasia esculenta]